MPQLWTDVSDNSPFKTVPLVGTVKVHTTAQGRFITGVDKVMDEGGYVGLEAAAIGPDTDIRAMPARQECHPRRDAKGIGTMIVGEANTLCCQLVKRWGSHEFISGTPKEVWAMLV
jgi:hypothetical protein